MKILALLLLASPVWCQSNTQPQFSLSGGDYKQDYSLINQMFQNISQDLTTTTPITCASNQTLTGAVYNKIGAASGGTCTTLSGIAVSTTSDFNSNVTFEDSSTFKGPVAISSTNQSGTHTVNDGSLLQVSTGAILMLGGLSGAQTTTGMAVYAKSTSGTSDAAGCIVFVSMSNAGTSTDTLIFASTTTTISMESGSAGVLLEPCTNGTVCKVGISGFFFVQADAAGIGATSTIRFSGTRCRALADGAIDSQTIGTKMNTAAIAANGSFWLRLGTGTIH